MLSLGLMSGTSMDGIDAALLETDGTPYLLKEKGFFSFSYDRRFSLLLKATEFSVRYCEGDLLAAKIKFSELIKLYFDSNKIDMTEMLSYFPHVKKLSFDDMAHHSTVLHAQVVDTMLKKTGYSAKDIGVVGYHGQTLFHQPALKLSVMLGEPQYLADYLKIKVIYDFRRHDIEAGGQGAPFAPLYHHALALRDKYLPLAVVNCGGISNVTLITSEDEADLIGFDAGPGNALIDTLVRKRTQGQAQMDRNGEYGKKGRVNEKILTALYEKSCLKENINYFSKKPPKSLDYGDITLIPELEVLSLEDACATLEAFTAEMIVKSVALVESNIIPRRWILAGGGWHNPVIRQELVNRLHQRYGEPLWVMTATEAGWNNQALEAQIFAYLAVRSILNKPLSVPGTTGVPHSLSGGMAFVPIQ